MAPTAPFNPDAQTDTLTNETKMEVCKKRASPGFLYSTVLLSNESQNELVDLFYQLLAQYDPATITEQILLEKMLHNHWLGLRAVRVQSLLFKKTIDLGHVPEGFGLIARCQVAAEKAFHRAHTELLKAQKERKNSTIGFESQKAQPPQAPQPESPRKTPESPTPQPSVTPEIVVPVVPIETNPEIVGEIADKSDKFKRAA